MSRLTRVGVLIGATVALGAAGWSGALAAPQRPSHHTSYGTLTVNITETSGTVWGKVAVAPLKKTCSIKQCVYKHVKVGTKITLTETPTDSQTWPFSKWTLNSNKSAGTGTALHFKMSKTSKAGAVYVLPTGTLTVNITTTGGYYGTTTWGSVDIEPLGHTCSASTCTYHNVPLNSQQTATETPTDSSTWPFSGWTFNGTNKGTSTSFQFTVVKSDAVDANYCAAPC